MKLRYLIVLFLVLLELSVLSENARYKFCYYGKAEGLYEQFVTSINQDNNGFLWIGTGNGLYKFDGITFQRYDSDNELSYDFVSSCIKDSLGRMWFGHLNGAVTVYNNGVFSTISTESKSSISDMFILGDNVWLGTQSDGFAIVDKLNGIVKVETPLPNRKIFSTKPIGYDRFLFATNEGLFISQFNQKSKRWSISYGLDELDNQWVKEIVEYPLDKNFLLVISESSVYSFNIITNRLKEVEFPADFDRNRIIPDFNDALFDKDGSLWITTLRTGVYQFHSRKGLVFHSFTNYSEKSGLKSDLCKHIFQDQEGNVWFGLSSEGLTRVIDNNLGFFTYEDVISNNNFTAVTKGPSQLWAGSNGFLVNINSESGKIISAFGAEDGVPNDVITYLYYQSPNLLWLGTEKLGLYTMDLETGLIKKHQISLSSLKNSINCIVGDEQYIWVATRGGLYRYNILTDEFRWFTSKDYSVFNNITHLFIDSKKRLFISSKGNRIHFLTKDMNIKILPYQRLDGSLIVQSIAEDRDANIWIGTYGNGIIKVQGDSVSSFNQNSGMYSDYCYSLFTQGQYVFVGHRGGISKIDILSNDIDLIDESQGLLVKTIFNNNAVTQDENQDIWFGSSEGLLRIKSEADFINKSTPPLINILSVKVDGEAIDFSKRIDLKNAEYKLEFNYIGIKQNNPQKVKYQYFLEGYDSDWSDYTSKRSISYTKARYGKYVFHLRAFNEHLIGDSYGEPIIIVIKKPFYLKVWFYLLILLALVWFVYLIIRYREQSLKEIQTNLMKKINESTRELIVKEEIIKERKRTEVELITAKNKAEESDMLKSALMSNMSHEIRTPLNAIVGFSNLLRDEDLENEERDEYINVITKNSDNLLALIEDIVDLSRIESNQIVVNLETISICKILKDVYYKKMEKAREFCGDKVEYHLMPLDEIEGLYVLADEIRLHQVFDKLVDNALKFTTSGSVIIEHELSKDFLFVHVTDTGIGISKEQIQYIFEPFRRVEGRKEILFGGAGIGLTIADKLGQLMNVKIDVRSVINQGSTFTVKVPISKED